MWNNIVHSGRSDGNIIRYVHIAGHAVMQWLRHCATSREIAGSIPYGVIAIFHLHIPSGRIMSLGSTNPLTEMSTSNIFLGVKAAGA
jgi:hypothetical protein